MPNDGQYLFIGKTNRSHLDAFGVLSSDRFAAVAGERSLWTIHTGGTSNKYIM